MVQQARPTILSSSSKVKPAGSTGVRSGWIACGTLLRLERTATKCATRSDLQSACSFESSLAMLAASVAIVG